MAAIEGTSFSFQVDSDSLLLSHFELSADGNTRTTDEKPRFRAHALTAQRNFAGAALGLLRISPAVGRRTSSLMLAKCPASAAA